MAEVIIYTTSYCPYCQAAKALLASKGVNYKEVDVENDSEKRAWLVAATGQKTVPQIFINGKSYGGFSDVKELDDAKKLDTILGI